MEYLHRKLFLRKMASSEDETESKLGGAVEWTVDMEIQLFYAMARLKPVGIHKHLYMACIWENLSNSITTEITTDDIWKHLDTLYDMQLLEDTEPIPFPNDEMSFSLPEGEFGHLMKQKRKETLSYDSDEARSASPKPATSTGSSKAPKESTPKSNKKDSVSGLAPVKSRKESGSSHASTDTPSIKSEKDYDRRRDSRDSNASGVREGSTSRKSTSHKEKGKSRVSSVAACDSPSTEEESSGFRRGRRRTNTSTPPATTPAKRRRT